MKYPILLSFACGFLLTLSACSSVSVDDYSKNSPKLAPQEFFNGNLMAKGVVKNRSGKVTRYFTATIDAHWKDGVGTLDEKFIFDDGEIQYRTWTLKPNGQNSFSGTAGDVIGVGDGKFSGNAINFKYVLAVKLKDSTVNLNVDDWMWLADSNTVINESILTKFGFKVGSIQLAMVKN
ncbi:MAG: DUF3833 domain-containing protein [Gammaproteobacteria bacterium]|nr:MAG: DUF3833 domain-containing protein [Gammaproteobacteria bacterium]